jgi:hypothetical protein
MIDPKTMTWPNRRVVERAKFQFPSHIPSPAETDSSLIVDLPSSPDKVIANRGNCRHD